MVQKETVGPNRDLLLLTKENPLVSLEVASAAHVRGAKAAPRKTSSLIGIPISNYLRGRRGRNRRKVTFLYPHGATYLLPANRPKSLTDT